MPDVHTYSSDVAFTPAVKAIQTRKGSREGYAQAEARGGWRTEIDENLASFLGQTNSFYLATATADGQPYIQHRGGPKGFVKILDKNTIAFADYAGNRQYITLGNLSENDRAYLFLLDVSRRQRIKLWGRARVVENDDALIERLFDHGYKAKPERVILFTIEAWDVNCSQHITARLTVPEVEGLLGTVQERIAALQAENAALRAKLAEQPAVIA
jgi:predicted pyridoxine 5'-phosphate oxidase superfamily flavin-nucleotide-binding protein